MNTSIRHQHFLAFLFLLLSFCCVSLVMSQRKGYEYGGKIYPSPQAALQAYMEPFLKDDASNNARSGAKQTHTGTLFQISSTWYGVKIMFRTKFEDGETRDQETITDNVIEKVDEGNAAAKMPEKEPDAATEPAPAGQALEVTRNGGKKVIGKFWKGDSLVLISKTKLFGGNLIVLQADKTTTITGTLTDVEGVAERGRYENGNINGITVMGENVGAINILRSGIWDSLIQVYTMISEKNDTTYNWDAISNGFWEQANKPWLQEAIDRGDVIRLVSNPVGPQAIYVKKSKTEFARDTEKNLITSLYGREIAMLKAAGYTIERCLAVKK